jgi:DNA adenine methylase
MHKGKYNEILQDWLNSNKNYKVNPLDFNYSNSNYQTLIRDKKASKEVLITNYIPQLNKQKTLFDNEAIKHEIYR